MLARLILTALLGAQLVWTDAYTHLRAATGEGNGPVLTTLVPPKRSAQATQIPVENEGAHVFAWTRKGSGNEAYIILHGIERNANDYFDILSDLTQGRTQQPTLIAPLFFSAKQDVSVLNASTLAWDDPNAWTGGDASTRPADIDVSTFQVLDSIVEYAARDSSQIIFLAHGGGAQVLQRYAVLGKDGDERTAIRYVVADPSSMLYFTKDRPVPLSAAECPEFNDFRYGFDNYTAPYELNGSPSELFYRYLERDVRYIVGLEDIDDSGDQLCAGRAAGGRQRKDRSLDYWAYLHALAGVKPIPPYPGAFPALDSSKSSGGMTTGSQNFLTSSREELSSFAKTPSPSSLSHQLFTVANAGHNADLVYLSPNGTKAVFDAAPPSSSSSMTASSTLPSAAPERHSSTSPSLQTSSIAPSPQPTQSTQSTQSSLAISSAERTTVPPITPSYICFTIALAATLVLASVASQPFAMS